MNRFIALLMVVTMFFTSTAAFAQTVVSLPPTPSLQTGEVAQGAVISPLKQNQKAPFTGLLLSPEAIAKIIVQLQNEQAETDIQVKKGVDTQKATDQLLIDNQNTQLQYLKTTTDLQLKNRDEEIATLTKKIDSEEKSRPNLPLWVGGGAIVGAFLTVLVVIGTSNAIK